MPEQRKLVTILFADTVGSTALGESLDPEDLRALMGRYYAAAVETMRSAIKGRKSSEPVGLLEHAASWASFAAYLSGCWSEYAILVPMVENSSAIMPMPGDPV